MDAQTDANRFLLDRYAPAAVILEENLRVIRARGGTSPYLELPSGDVSVEILKMIRPELGYALRGALSEARTRGRPASKPGLRFKLEGRVRAVDLQVVPLGGPEMRQFLVLFEAPVHAPAPPSRAGRKPSPDKSGRNPMAALDRELRETRQQLQAIIDDLGATNEELQSANEEISSSNEELQSTKSSCSRWRLPGSVGALRARRAGKGSRPRRPGDQRRRAA
jgi:two-component system, chemotaxis family, CheB/CheR fusion protein